VVGWLVYGGSRKGATGFCGPCECLGVFPLLYWRVLIPGIVGDRVGTVS
jgi:hypothetical protein